MSIEKEEKKERKKVIKENYFDQREEDAVLRFLATDSAQERNEIYNTYLKGPLDKMISSIIRRYKLYRKDMDFIEIHHDTHGFLMTKVEKFKPAKNKKAYSYFGTICKNYLMGQIIKDQKDTNRNVSYEDISSSLENRPDMVYYLENEKTEADDIIQIFISELKTYLEQQNLSDNEIKLGISLLELFENYKTNFESTENNKYNKNIILLSIREMTNLNTKEIRSSMKKFKKLYLSVLNKVIDQ
jgi:hypothetical protein